jgi:hypothetical protein
MDGVFRNGHYDLEASFCNPEYTLDNVASLRVAEIKELLVILGPK